MTSTHQANTGLEALNENVDEKYLVGIDPSILEAKDFTIEKLVADNDNLKAQVALLKKALEDIQKHMLIVAGSGVNLSTVSMMVRKALTRLDELEKGKV